MACEKAEQAHRRGDKAEVVQHLSKIPSHLLDKEAKTLLANSESECSVKDSRLETELRAAINAKDWETVGALVEQLLEADPQHQAGLKVSKKSPKDFLLQLKNRWNRVISASSGETQIHPQQPDQRRDRETPGRGD